MRRFLNDNQRQPEPQRSDALAQLRAFASKPGACPMLQRVELLAEALTEAMEEVHGSPWRFNIDHERGYVLIAPR